MIEVSTTQGVNEFHQLLKLVERGESVRIMNHGRARARLVPDTGFISGAETLRLFYSWKGNALDQSAASEIEKNIEALNREADPDALAH
jgi:antitoxin (DNA-binding transcriptional repressor) of toxin-antitoxin stability system